MSCGLLSKSTGLETMPFINPTSKLVHWVTSQRNITIFTAIIIGVPTAYAFQITVGGNGMSGDFLLLMLLAVGVPTAYDEYWSHYENTWIAIVWILAACTLVTIEFTGLYLIGTGLLSLSPLASSAGAFLITSLGNLAWLGTRSR